jgi:hypothetical protein
MPLVAVKGTINQLDLPDAFVNKILDFSLNARHREVSDSMYGRGQTVLAVEGAASAGFIVNNFIIQLFKVFVREWYIIKLLQQRAFGIGSYLIVYSIGQTFYW